VNERVALNRTFMDVMPWGGRDPENRDYGDVSVGIEMVKESKRGLVVMM